jgi:uncharacterized protein DUF5681
MVKSKNGSNYLVGYGCPPQHTRFQPGQYGNPSGRPKGTKNLKTDLMEELAERISISEGGKPKKLSKQRALVKSLTAKAIKGDARAIGILLNLMLKVLQGAEEATESDFVSDDDVAALEIYAARVLSGAAERLGQAAETPKTCSSSEPATDLGKQKKAKRPDGKPAPKCGKEGDRS